MFPAEPLLTSDSLLTPEAADFLYAAGVPLEYHYTHWNNASEWRDASAFDHEMEPSGAKKLSECVEWNLTNRPYIPRGTKVLLRVKK